MTTEVVIKHNGPDHMDLLVHAININTTDGSRTCTATVRLRPGEETSGKYAYSGMSFEVVEVARIEATPDDTASSANDDSIVKTESDPSSSETQQPASVTTVTAN